MSGSSLLVFLCLSGLPFLLTTVKLVEIKIGHELGFDMVDHVFQAIQEAIEILFVQVNGMAVEAIPEFTAGTFGQADVKVISLGAPDVDEIGASSSRMDFVGADELRIFFVVIHR